MCAKKCLYLRIKDVYHMAEESNDPRWTEIEHLPQWDEEFYNIYTAKKLGKWVMLKTLRPQYKDEPEYQEMIEKEFDVRYNLAHPNIVMINDFEDVPGLGRCIVTDDVYGLSLRQIIDEGKLTDNHLQQILHQMVSALSYIQTNHIVHHPIRPERIIFTENIENLKLIDVGYEQRPSLTPCDVKDDIYNYGLVLKEALEASGIDNYTLNYIARKCLDSNPKRRFKTVDALRLALDGRSSSTVLMGLLLMLIGIIGLLVTIMILK